MTALDPSLATTSPSTAQTTLLIINPNSTASMTSALEPLVRGLPYKNTSYQFFTSPSPGIPSINGPTDALESAKICWPALQPLIASHQFDAYLVACYSAHPLVGMIRAEISGQRAQQKERGEASKRVYVTGIFEASVLSALSSLDIGFSEAGTSDAGERFGIVSTGKIWEEALTTAVCEFLAPSSSSSAAFYDSPRFAGCETTGLNATELHDLPAEEVRRKMRDATVRLLERDGGRVAAVCLGCAGMVGLEGAVREGCVQVFGDRGFEVRIVDGVVAGVGVLVGMVGGGF